MPSGRVAGTNKDETNEHANVGITEGELDTAPAQWQAKLYDEFAAYIDPSLITALAHEPGQTFEDIHAILTSLAGDAIDSVNQHDFAYDKQQDRTDDDSKQTASPPSLPLSTELESVERALQEWSLANSECGDPDNLRMTDEEDADQHDFDGQQHREAVHAGLAAGKGVLPDEEIAAGQENMAFAQISPGDVLSSDDAHASIAFLVHAFPTRTAAFLQSMLDEANGDVSQTVDTLTTLELVESGALDADDSVYDATMSQARGAATSSRVKMSDDEQNLLNGVGGRKSTKRDRQRRRAEQAHANAFGTINPSAPHKVYLNDVRQGGPSREVLHKRLQPARTSSDKSAAVAAEDEDDAAMAARLAREERIAAGLPAEEKDEESRDSAVCDNDWLFSSSVMEQLGLLLSLPSHKVRSVHASCHMNLRATMHRLVYMQCEQYPSLDTIDELSHQPSGTARSLLDGLCALIPGKARNEVERYLRATGGREDAVLDLVQLADRVELSAAGERTDVLDPRKVERTASPLLHAPTFTTAGTGQFSWVGDNKPLADGRSASVSALPYVSAAHRFKSNTAADTASRTYALQRLREGAPSVTFPLNSGHASAAGQTAGDNDLASAGPTGKESAAQAARLAHEYSAIAQEYRVRRQECLAKAARSYRSTHNAAVARGPMRGAAAWVYADEARRLDAKARAFALQAAQATVRYRMLTNRSLESETLPGGNAGRTGDMVDLHGLTVHQSLTITHQALDAWWPKAAASERPLPLHVVTGVGRHSRGHVALVRPAVLAMLQRERWICREPQQGHILVMGKK